eukprot:Gb_32764 [translate_table: standard]
MGSAISTLPSDGTLSCLPIASPDAPLIPQTSASTPPTIIPQMSFPNTNTTTSADLRNAMFQNISTPADLKDLIHLIDKRLSIIEKGKSLGEGRMMLTASSTLTSDGSKLLNGISGKALKLKEFGVIDGTKTAVASVLKGFGKLHMVAAGLSMVAYTLEEFGRISSNQSECVELLREIINTSKHLTELDEVLPEDKKAKLDKAVRMMSGGAIMCCSLMDSAPLMQLVGIGLLSCPCPQTNHRSQRKLSWSCQHTMMRVSYRLLACIGKLLPIHSDSSY